MKSERLKGEKEEGESFKHRKVLAFIMKKPSPSQTFYFFFACSEKNFNLITFMTLLHNDDAVHGEWVREETLIEFEWSFSSFSLSEAHLMCSQKREFTQIKFIVKWMWEDIKDYRDHIRHILSASFY